jgi:hypothetical protein
MPIFSKLLHSDQASNFEIFNLFSDLARSDHLARLMQSTGHASRNFPGRRRNRREADVTDVVQTAVNTTRQVNFVAGSNIVHGQ